jgi:hypothetical protein
MTAENFIESNLKPACDHRTESNITKDADQSNVSTGRTFEKKRRYGRRGE